MMPMRGVMAVWNDLEPGHEAAFEAWYEKQHVRERLHVAGFRWGRRYVATSGSPRYCAFYWLDDVQVLVSPPYLERLANPTRTTTRMMPRFRNMGRTPCAISLERGDDMGDCMSWIASIGSGSGRSPGHSVPASFARIPMSSDIARMQLWQCDPSIARLHNPEQGLRVGNDSIAAWIVFVEAKCEAAVDAALGFLAQELDGVAPGGTLQRGPSYRLISSLRAEDAPLPCPDDLLSIEPPN